MDEIGMDLPVWADLHCVECQGPVTRISPVIADPDPVSWGICTLQDGPVVLGWTALPCLHFVDAKDWTFAFELQGPDGPRVWFEPCQAVK